jgi:transcriptional regulator with XRE-family HTH domain
VRSFAVILNPEDIKQLRQRLGWSLAEMARRMGCSVDIVSAWEAGHQSPDSEVINQMEYLESYLHSYSQRISQTPLAEKVMHEDRLSQLTHRDLIDRTFKV